MGQTSRNIIRVQIRGPVFFASFRAILAILGIKEMFENIELFISGKASLKVEKSGLPTTRDLQVSVAGLLIKMANADNFLAAKEIKALIETLGKEFSLNDQEVGDLISIAEFMIKDSVRLDEFLATINDRFDKSQKRTLFSMIWKVMKADGLVTQSEAKLASALALQLNLNKEDILEAQKLTRAK